MQAGRAIREHHCTGPVPAMSVELPVRALLEKLFAHALFKFSCGVQRMSWPNCQETTTYSSRLPLNFAN
jgi:hypothetical protein